MAKHLGISGGVFAAALSLTLAVGCSDDDKSNGKPSKGNTAGKANDGDGGEEPSGTSGSGTSGKSGTSGSGGSSGSGTAGSSGSGTSGTAGNPSGTAGDAGNEGGAGGERNEPVVYKPVSEVRWMLFPRANDLKGLRFSASGKIWASGHEFINASPSVLADPDKHLIIARFTEDGLPDTTFSDDGYMSVNLAVRTVVNDVITNDGNEESYGLVELANGDIVVQANVRDANGKGMDVVLARYTSAGAPVTTFGTNGVAHIDFGWTPTDDATWPTANAAPSDTSWGVELDKSNNQERIVVFGFGPAIKGAMSGTPAAQRTDNDRYITRVSAADGAIDPAFNAGKVFTYNAGTTFSDAGRRGIVEADGSILSAGYCNFGTGFGNHAVIIRLKPDGTADGSFGFGVVDKGVVRANPVIDDGGVVEAYGITRQKSGRIVTTGYGNATAANTASRFGYATSVGPDLMSLGISKDGKRLDPEFGQNGLFVAQSEELALARSEERGRDVNVLADDRLVYVGNFGTDPAIFIVNPNGEFDPANGVGQLFRYKPLTVTVNGANTSTSHFMRVQVSPDGKRVVAATSQNVDGVLIAVLKVDE